ncbi:MAG: GTPase HflX [Phycisphaerales bacterium]|nr:MAG: GTPase HflX [Phycisphaerales bacterium]
MPQLEALSDIARTDLSVHQERAFLVKVIIPGMNYDAHNPLRELAALASAAGAVVTNGLIQKRASPSPRTYLGRGKLQELREQVAADEADTIIFDNDLAPAQIRELEKATERKIIDRSELILDIFATRARTHEAKLQVELAQLEYTAPRLRGMWTHLERIAGAAGATGAGVVGGIGTRGPGERQIEIDRRIVADRIAHLKRQIEQIENRKIREVHSRSDQFTVSLVGYTNAGKSSLMNALTDAGQQIEDKLFATLDTRTARWVLGNRHVALLSDTVGFVRDLPHHLVASFRATLEETLHARLLLHVVDVAAPDALWQVESVQAVLADLGCADAPTIALLNKVDVAQNEALITVLENRLPQSICVSAKTGYGLDHLVERVVHEMRRRATHITVRTAVGDGRLIAEIDRLAEVVDRRYVGNATEMVLNIDHTHLEQLLGRYPDLKVVSPADSIPPDAGRDPPRPCRPDPDR